MAEDKDPNLKSPDQPSGNDEDKDKDSNDPEVWKKRYADSTKGFQTYKEESEEKIAALQQEAGSWKTWAESVSPYLTAIAADKDLMANLRERIEKGVTTPPTAPPEGGKPKGDDKEPPAFDLSAVQKEVDERFKPILDLQESQIISQFEREKGWDQLPVKERTENRAKLATYLGRWVGSKGRAPLHQLGDFLTDAYKLAFTEEAGKEAELAKQVREREAAKGALPGMSSKGLEGETVELTDEEKKVAEKQGIEEKDYAEQKKMLGR